MTDTAVAEFQAHRARLFGIAYRMLGSASEAEDIVQEAYLRWERTDRGAVAAPGPWLAKVVTNLSLNELSSARVRRERYVGEWLPEPVLTATAKSTGRVGTRAPAGVGVGGAVGATPPLGPLETAEQRDSVSFALLVLLERLTPPERAVFVLRAAFDYSHREIAELLDISEANSRQLYRRAKQAVHAHNADDNTVDSTADDVRHGPQRRERWVGLVETFVTAAREGDLAQLERLLADDVVSYADGGGRITSARRPIVGPAKVARYLARGLSKYAAGVDLVPYEVNGGPALLALAEGQLLAVVSLEIADGRVTALRISLNPDKLAYAARQVAACRPLG
ncbi:RNA polymerase sigma factor SigJ [Streptomyces oryzae]|uniref:RNA polymerase sigma factor SigJ n=1 Tax=Streptomyces oryzae TaxID=1434886 RepID=A0ABS3X9Y3_9ACTN|nr:RNA polymerase sigma factor SigJ [Streptomyces oryzae]MBO8192178.1 RNA polymerase sigma factor SigJ [Streptomyces oryzae]